MEKGEDLNTDNPVPSVEKHNTGAKIGIALAASGIGAKLAIPGLVMDANSLFPKGTPLGTKFKQAFSKEILPLIGNSIAVQMQKGRGQMMATLGAMKWSIILSTVGSIVLGVIGWKRADRIENSKDIYKHPIKSAKIILGMEEPDSKKASQATDKNEVVGKHTDALLSQRAATSEATLER
ncbi:MAG: hypothetical protein ACOYNL_06495 [Rickettsiales bacterium]